MNQQPKVRIAVAGGGYWGKNLVRNFSELGALQAICDSDTAKLQEYGRLYPGVAATADYNKILEDASISGIVIATPAAQHYQMAKLALEAGKDIMVEKPLALNLAQGRELARLAGAKGLVLMVGHVLEYHPAVQELVSLVKSGYLGQINYIYSNRLNLGKFRTEENILWSFAPHDISIIIRIMGEMPLEVNTFGGAYLNPAVADVTITNLYFASGVKGHIFVSWLHPFKEQKLVVVGSKRMAVFDDVSADKLKVYAHKVNWVEKNPVAARGEAENIDVSAEEPLKRECMHFLECVRSRKEPLTGAQNALDVLNVLTASQKSLAASSVKVSLEREEDDRHGPEENFMERPEQTERGLHETVYVHPSSLIETGVSIGPGSSIWHFCHLMPGSRLGRDCSLGQNVFVGSNVSIGNNVKIQNNVSVYEGVILEDDVFCGPSCVFTNVKTPRSAYPRNNAGDYRQTLVKEGASIGANATILSGIIIGEHAMIGAGSLVARDVPGYAVVAGNPAEIRGWICMCGNVIQGKNARAIDCPTCGTRKEIQMP